MTLTSEYFDLQKLYEQKYGCRTIVLIQVGSFYEAYQYDPSKIEDTDEKSIGHASEISTLLNMLLTSKTKSKPHSIENPYMFGFPCISYERQREVILSHNWTIVRVDQVSNDTGNFERKVTEIASAATEIDCTIQSSSDTNQIISIYIECQKPNRRNEDYTLITGMSCIDVTTGENKICEVYSQNKN